MVDFEKLAEAMGDLDEDAMVEGLNQVMAEGGADAAKAMEACQTLSEVLERAKTAIQD